MPAADFRANDWTDRLQVALGARYTIERRLTGGGMSAVFLAREVEFDRPVVIKLLPRELADADAAERFRREIALVAHLQHPQIVPLLAAGECEGLPWFVMPYVDGESLSQRLRRGPLSIRETVSILIDVCRALSMAHDRDVVHRDIKPGNILLMKTSAVVSDFGVAKAVASTRHRLPVTATALPSGATVEGMSLGTPAYMAPEQVVGDPGTDFRADLYSLGAVAYEMLVGSPPFAGRAPHKLLAAHLTEHPPPPSTRRAEVPGELESLIMSCLAKDPAARPRSALDIMRALQNPDVLNSAPGRRAARARDAKGRSIGAMLRRFLLGAWRMIRHEVRPAIRSLARAPTVSISAILCLSLGLGVTAAVSSALDRALLRHLPFDNPAQLVTVYRTTPQSDAFPFSAPNFVDLARTARQLPAMAGMTDGTVLVSMPDQAVEARRVRVTGGFFPLLGAHALRGRLLTETDDSLSQPRVVVLSEAFWQRVFGADPTVLSRAVQIDGEPVTVVGILPRDFAVPNGGRQFAGDLWEPMRFSERELTSRRSNFLSVLGRLAPGGTAGAAQRDLVARFAAIVELHPELASESVRAVPMHGDSLAPVRAPLLLLFGAVIIVLLIASTNVASLLLARGVRRQRELAVRTALGASRWDVMRPVLVESVLLALAGVAGGLGLAVLGVQSIGRLAAERMPQLTGLVVDMRIVLFALTLALLVAIVCGLFPAWQGTTVDPQDALRGGRGAGAGAVQHRALGALVVAQVALSLVLLIGAGLVLKGFTSLLTSDPGFEPDRMLTLAVRVARQRYEGQSVVQRFLEPVLAEIGRVPGVAASGATSLMPYREWGWNFNIQYEGQPGDNPASLLLAETRIATPGFFGVTQQRLMAGRLLVDADDDRPAAPRVVLANQALVDRDFKGVDPVGKRFHLGDTTFATIVGVVSNIRNVGPIRPPAPEVYFPYRQSGGNGGTGFALLVRVAGGDPERVIPSVLAAIRAVDRGAAITSVLPMRAVMAESVGRPRFLFSLIGTFAAVAVLLAIAGIYGVMSYAVAQRTREIGIRSALGSTPGRIVRELAGTGVRLVGIGSLLGLLLGVGTTRLLQGLLYGVSPLDAGTWMLALLAMLAVGLLACVVPSLRAAKVDALVAIRVE